MIIRDNAYNVTRGFGGRFNAWRGSVLDDFGTFCAAYHYARGIEASPFHKIHAEPTHWCECHGSRKEARIGYSGGIEAVVSDTRGDYPSCFYCGGAYEEGDNG